MFSPWMASLARSLVHRPRRARAAPRQPPEKAEPPLLRDSFAKKGSGVPHTRGLGLPSLPQSRASPRGGQRAQSTVPHCPSLPEETRGRWEQPLRGGTGGQERGRAGSWPAELLSPLHRNRHRVPTKGKLSPLPGGPHLSFPIRATCGSRLCYPHPPLCSTAAHHPPNLDTKQTHWHSDTFSIPTDGTPLPLGHLSPVQVPAQLLAVTDQVTMPPHRIVGPARTTQPHAPRSVQPPPQPSPALGGGQQQLQRCDGDTAHARLATVPTPPGPQAWKTHLQQLWRVLQMRNTLSSLCWHLLQARPFPGKPWS